jgi:hypothetical protein
MNLPNIRTLFHRPSRTSRVAMALLGMIGVCAMIVLFAMEQYQSAQLLFWTLGIVTGAGFYIRGARRRDEERLWRSADHLLERQPSTLDPNRLEGRAQAQADRPSYSPRNRQH